MSDHYAVHYTTALNFGLVKLGTGKIPIENGWQNKPHTAPLTGNIGLHHGYSGTATLDIDHGLASKTLAAVGIDLDSILNDAPYKIVGNPDNPPKPLYRLPADSDLKTVKLTYRNGSKSITIFELRGGSGFQDVLPPSIHPDTKKPYRWVDDKMPQSRDDIPTLPASLLMLWQNWEMLLPKMQAVNPWQAPAPERRATPAPVAVGNEVEKARAALGRLHPWRADDYDTWLNIGMALKSLDEGLLSEWERFSQQSSKYKGGECEKKWASFNRNGITIATLHKFANEDDPPPLRSTLRTHLNGNGHHAESLRTAIDEDDPPDLESTLESILQKAIAAKEDEVDHTIHVRELAEALVMANADDLVIGRWAGRLKNERLANKGDFTKEIERLKKEQQAALEAEAETNRETLYPAFPYYNDDGRTLFCKVAPDGSVTGVPVADFTARITTEIVGEDGTRYYGIGGETASGVPFVFEISTGDFADARTLKTKLLEAAGAKAPVYARQDAHLGPSIQKFTNGDLRQERRFDRTGWTDGKFLIPGREPDDVTIHLPRKLCYRVDTEADLDSGLAALSHLLKTGVPEQSTMVMAYILGAPVAQAAGWRESDRYGMFLSGQTGSLKTSFCQCAMSIYGPGFLKDTSLLRFGDGATPKSLQKYAASAHDMPILFDNYKPNLMPPRYFYGLLHAVMEGSERDALTRNREIREGSDIYAWPLFTGEDTPSDDPASIARLIKLDWSGGGQDDLSKAQSLGQHLPAVGNLWIEWLESTEGRRVVQDIAMLFEGRRKYWADWLMSANDRSQNRLRMASNLAINELVYQIMRDSPMEWIFGGDGLPEAHRRGLETVADQMAHLTAEGLEAIRYLDALRELIDSKRCTLANGRGESLNQDAYQNIGWQDAEGVYLLPTLARKAVDDLLGRDALGGVTKNKIHSQLRDLGVLARFDENNNRIPVSVRCGGKTRRVLHLYPTALDAD